MELELDVVKATLKSVSKALEATIGMTDDFASGMGHLVVAISELAEDKVSDETLQQGRDAINSWQQAKPKLLNIVQEVKTGYGED
jgi:hypothetical protein